MSYDTLDIILSPNYFKKGTSEDWELLTDPSKGMLRNKRFIGGVWNGLDLSERSFDRSGFLRTNLISFDFSSARFKGLLDAFSRCKCDETNFSSTRFLRAGSSSSVFLRCSFVGSVWEKLAFIDCLFYKCDLTGVCVDTTHPFLRTVFKGCLMPDSIAEQLKTLNAVISD